MNVVFRFLKFEFFLRSGARLEGHRGLLLCVPCCSLVVVFSERRAEAHNVRGVGGGGRL